MITEKGKKFKKIKLIERVNKAKRRMLLLLSMMGYFSYIIMNSLTRTEKLTYNIGENAPITVFIISTVLFLSWLVFLNLDEYHKIKNNIENYDEFDDGDYYNDNSNDDNE